MENQITLDSIKSKIAGECYIVLPDGRTTVCMLSMKNGYTIKGMSACMKASNFNIDVGRLEAYEDAVRQIWQFEDYLLAEKLHNKAEAEKKTSNYWEDLGKRLEAFAPVPKKPPKIKKARYGLKKDGTPRSKPGRKPSK